MNRARTTIHKIAVFFPTMSLKASIQKDLKELIAKYSSNYTEEDIYRVLHEEAFLGKETAVLRTRLKEAQHEHRLDQKTVSRLQACRVVSCHRIQSPNGYSSIEAVVRLNSDSHMKNVKDHVDLSFRYEREGRNSTNGQTHVWYSVELSRDHGPREKILWCQIFASHFIPSDKEPINIALNQNDNDEWSDMDDDIDDGGDNSSTLIAEDKREISEDQGPSKRQRSSSATNDSDEDEADRFYAGMDTDVLSQFLQWSHIEMNPVEAFFTLMSFPFYELEWDIIDLLVSSVFDDDESSSGDDGSKL